MSSRSRPAVSRTCPDAHRRSRAWAPAPVQVAWPEAQWASARSSAGRSLGPAWSGKGGWGWLSDGRCNVGETRGGSVVDASGDRFGSTVGAVVVVARVGLLARSSWFDATPVLIESTVTARVIPTQCCCSSCWSRAREARNGMGATSHNKAWPHHGHRRKADHRFEPRDTSASEEETFTASDLRLRSWRPPRHGPHCAERRYFRHFGHSGAMARMGHCVVRVSTSRQFFERVDVHHRRSQRGGGHRLGEVVALASWQPIVRRPASCSASSMPSAVTLRPDDGAEVHDGADERRALECVAAERVDERLVDLQRRRPGSGRGSSATSSRCRSRRGRCARRAP